MFLIYSLPFSLYLVVRQFTLWVVVHWRSHSIRDPKQRIISRTDGIVLELKGQCQELNHCLPWPWVYKIIIVATEVSPNPGYFYRDYYDCCAKSKLHRSQGTITLEMHETAMKVALKVQDGSVVGQNKCFINWNKMWEPKSKVAPGFLEPEEWNCYLLERGGFLEELL